MLTPEQMRGRRFFQCFSVQPGVASSTDEKQKRKKKCELAAGFWVLKLILDAARLLIWLSLSSVVILSNKWLLHPMRFPFPVTLTCWHMIVSAAVGAVAVMSGQVTQTRLSWQTWAAVCLPIGALSAASLFFGNMAFMYLTVAFMQMLKANMPVIIFVVGCLFATERFTLASFGIMVLIAFGVALASYGELNFSLLGMSCMLGAMSSEAVRLTLVQTMLQRQDLKLTPLSSLYYVMPISTLCLLPIALISEGQGLHQCIWLKYANAPALIANAAGAASLNLAIYVVVGTMSALTMKLAAVVKDIGLVAVSCALFGDTLTSLGMCGYGIALVGVCLYNWRKIRSQQQMPCTTTTRSEQEFAGQKTACLCPARSTEADWQIPAVNKILK